MFISFTLSALICYSGPPPATFGPPTLQEFFRELEEADAAQTADEAPQVVATCQLPPNNDSESDSGQFRGSLSYSCQLARIHKKTQAGVQIEKFHLQTPQHEFCYTGVAKSGFGKPSF